jgi:prolyl-tRNA editing enzyme YbaK/EbsC (Cys-tRNA(Pro) deacylase)
VATKKLDALLEFCKLNKDQIERMVFDQPVRSVQQAVEVSGYPKSNFIKTVLLRHKSEGNYICTVITGGSKVDKKVLQDGVNPKRWGLATPEEVLEVTGFPVGGVPQVCLGSVVKIYVDPRVLTREYVIGGGGTANSLLKLNPELIKENGAVEKVVSFGHDSRICSRRASSKLLIRSIKSSTKALPFFVN